MTNKENTDKDGGIVSTFDLINNSKISSVFARFWEFIVIFIYISIVIGVSQDLKLFGFTLDSMCNSGYFLYLFCDFFGGFLVKNESDLLTVMGVIGGILLTVMIPLSIAIFNDKDGYKNLDRDVMLEHIIKAKWLLSYLGLIYVPILLWVAFHAPLTLQIVYLFLWGRGVFGMMTILMKSYEWLKGDEFKLRLDYLRKLKHSNNTEKPDKSWRTFWSVKDAEYEHAVDFFNTFAIKIDVLLCGNPNDVHLAGKLISSFGDSINKRSPLFFAYSDELLSKFLDWYLFTWERSFKIAHKEPRAALLDCQSISTYLRLILIDVGKRTLRDASSDYFYDHFKKHVEKHKGKSVEGKQQERRYIVVMMDCLVEILAGDGKKPDDVWDKFPCEWQITSANIENEENEEKTQNRVCWVLCERFVKWSSIKYYYHSATSKEIASTNFIECLFPFVCTVMWKELLTYFAIYNYDDVTMKNVIESPQLFAQVSDENSSQRVVRLAWFRYKHYSGMGKDDIKKAEEKESINLSLYLGGHTFTKWNLDNLVDELEQMGNDYQEKKDAEIENRRNHYIRIFTKILNIRHQRMGNMT